MFKKLATILVLVAALNFVAVLGAVGALAATGRLSRASAAAIKDALFPPATQPTTQPATMPTTAPADAEPWAALDAVLARRPGGSAGERVALARANDDARRAELERARREAADVLKQIELAQQQNARDRADLAQQQARVDAAEQERQRRAVDEGFKQALALYDAMPPKQVKGLLGKLPDDDAARYLRAMEPKRASKILKEFKTPAELEQAQRLFDKLRAAEAGDAQAARADNAGG